MSACRTSSSARCSACWLFCSSGGRRARSESNTARRQTAAPSASGEPGADTQTRQRGTRHTTEVLLHQGTHSAELRRRSLLTVVSTSSRDPCVEISSRRVSQ
jgi:hypothetical protein